MRLYELSDTFRELFDRYEAISTYEFDKDDQGRYIDDAGSVIPDVDAARAEMVQAWFDTLEGIEEEFGDKAENILVFIKGLVAEAEEMRIERARLTARISAKDKQAERLKEYIMKCMDDIGVKKLDGIRATCSLRSNAESVEVLNDIEFINWAQANDRDDLLKYEMPSIKKTPLKKELQAGTESIPGVRLTRSRSLIIK